MTFMIKPFEQVQKVARNPMENKSGSKVGKEESKLRYLSNKKTVNKETSFHF